MAHPDENLANLSSFLERSARSRRVPCRTQNSCLERPQLRVGADRIARNPRLRKRGPGRLVRYNDPSDVDCLPEAVADLDGNRESCGDLPG